MDFEREVLKIRDELGYYHIGINQAGVFARRLRAAWEAETKRLNF